MIARIGANGLAEEVEAMEVALEVGMADLDLEGAVTKRVGAAEEL